MGGVLVDGFGYKKGFSSGRYIHTGLDAIYLITVILARLISRELS